MNDGLGGLEGEMFSYAGNASDMEKGRFADSSNVGLKGEGVVKDNTQVSGRRSWVNVHGANLDGRAGGGLIVFGVNGKELSLIVVEFNRV